MKQEYPQIQRDKKPIFAFLSGDEIHNLEGMELLKTLEVIGHQDFGFFRGTTEQWIKAISFVHNEDKPAASVVSQPASAHQEFSNELPNDHPAFVGASVDVPEQTEEEIFAELSRVPIQLPPRASAVRGRQLNAIWSERLNEEADLEEPVSSSTSEFVKKEKRL